MKHELGPTRYSISWISCFFLTASEEEHPQDMRAVLPPEEEMAFLGLKTLDQRRILMLLTKQPEEEISEVEVGVPHEVS